MKNRPDKCICNMGISKKCLCITCAQNYFDGRLCACSAYTNQSRKHIYNDKAIDEYNIYDATYNVIECKYYKEDFVNIIKYNKHKG